MKFTYSLNFFNLCIPFTKKLIFSYILVVHMCVYIYIYIYILSLHVNLNDETFKILFPNLRHLNLGPQKICKELKYNKMYNNVFNNVTKCIYI